MQMPRAGLELNRTDKQKLNQHARLPIMSVILFGSKIRPVPPGSAPWCRFCH